MMFFLFCGVFKKTKAKLSNNLPKMQIYTKKMKKACFWTGSSPF